MEIKFKINQFQNKKIHLCGNGFLLAMVGGAE